ncbi:M23 family metallopeptidase [uncultured Pelagimonas sp.]|uniref:M23 family metallopeptidase n=1 Tax=uncultured Pelagimonas sp. TaxID=1618102 RepID=UPI002635A1AF|nr:M23 family metallopeptidase [uncultured Pelagimonas sp.]
MRIALIGAIALLAQSAQAEDLRLGFPLDCTLGETCYIEDYVDHDPTKGVQTDYQCGLNARDGHKGTDFALLSFDDIKTGVAVFATAPGRVLRIRDEMPDDREMRGVTSQNACGNAIVIEHAQGWASQYCHLRLGSVTKQPGDIVETGDVLGLVGLSGQTNHPHLHFSVYQGKTLIDPFQPGPLDSCQIETDSMWADPIQYVRTGILTAGFADHVPNLNSVRNGSARLDTGKPTRPIVIYMHAGHAEHGDVLQFVVSGPKGEVFNHDMVLKHPKVSQMRAFGRKAPSAGWAKGDYLGEATLVRKGKVIAHRFAHITIE